MKIVLGKRTCMFTDQSLLPLRGKDKLPRLCAAHQIPGVGTLFVLYDEYIWTTSRRTFSAYGLEDSLGRFPDARSIWYLSGRIGHTILDVDYEERGARHFGYSLFRCSCNQDFQGWKCFLICELHGSVMLSIEH